MSKFHLWCSCLLCKRETTSGGLFFHYKNGCYKLSTAPKTATNRGHKIGTPAWNKGLTKTDPRVAKNSESAATTLRSQIADGTRKPSVMSDEAKIKLSIEQSLRNRGGRSRWFEVNGQKVQGTWERNIALKFDECDIKWIKTATNTFIWKYSHKGAIRSYSPDFYLPDHDIWIEIKGFWWGHDRDKMEAIFTAYPERKLIIIEKSQYEKLLRSDSRSMLRELVRS